jgi:nucleotide-binding universal stress UspA family protein
MIALKNILVPTDFGDAANVAFAYGLNLADVFGGTLHVLHVTDNVGSSGGYRLYVAMNPITQAQVDDAARRQLESLIRDRRGKSPEMARRPKCRAVIRTSTTPAHAIVAYAREARIDLIVMGTHGRGPLEHLLLGSVAEPVIRMAARPVLTVHHPEHDFIVPEPVRLGTPAFRSVDA